MTAELPQRLPDRRLSKRAVEQLLAAYDTDPVGALGVALQSLCGRPTATFDELIATADRQWSPQYRTTRRSRSRATSKRSTRWPQS